MTKAEFIKTMDGYKSELHQFTTFGSISDKVKTKEIIDVWDKFKNEPEIARERYQGVLKITPPTDMGCNSCKSTALRDVVKWVKHLKKDIYIEFKGVPQARVVEEEVSTLNESKDKYDQFKGLPQKKQSYKEVLKDVLDSVEEDDRIELSGMKWGAFKKLCKEQGLKTYKKTREQLMEELNND